MANETNSPTPSMEIIKKHRIAIFLDTGNDLSNPNYRRIKKSTEFTLNMNPETVTYDYIADESPTEELDKYKPSISQPLTMYKGEPDFEMVYKRFFEMSTGLDAHARVMIVFMFDGDKESGYKAWESDSVITIDNLDSVASTITFNVLFGGTVRKGIAKMDGNTPVFTEGIDSPASPSVPGGSEEGEENAGTDSGGSADSSGTEDSDEESAFNTSY